jgi:hypothetical protein
MISSMLEKMLNLKQNAGELDVELIPKELWQNVVVLLKQEFPTPAGYGTEVAEGKEERNLKHVM